MAMLLVMLLAVVVIVGCAEVYEQAGFIQTGARGKKPNSAKIADLDR